MTYEEFVNLFVNKHKGHENAIPRIELEKLAGKDRVNRDTFLQMWKEGYFVINDMSGGGYYLVNRDDPKDMQRFAKYLTTRLKAVGTESEKLSLGQMELCKYVMQGGAEWLIA